MEFLTALLIVGIAILCAYFVNFQKKEKKNESKPTNSKPVASGTEKSMTIKSTTVPRSRRRMREGSARSPRCRDPPSTRSLKNLTDPNTLRHLITSFDSRPGACHCGNAGNFEVADRLEQANAKPFIPTNKPEVFPIAYENYNPVDLTSPPFAEGTELGKAALTSPPEGAPDVLTAFNPVLHAIYFAHHYADMLTELVDNYCYLG